MDNTIKSKVLNYIEENKERLFELLSELIKVNSENFGTNGNEKAMAEIVAKQFDSIGVKSDVYPPDSIPGFTEHFEYLAGRNTDKRPNVTGILKGTKPKEKLMLTAHIDTMPIGDETFGVLTHSVEQSGTAEYTAEVLVTINTRLQPRSL